MYYVFGTGPSIPSGPAAADGSRLVARTSEASGAGAEELKRAFAVREQLESPEVQETLRRAQALAQLISGLSVDLDLTGMTLASR